MVSPAPDAHKNFSSFDSSIQPECRGYLYEEAILSNLKKLGLRHPGAVPDGFHHAPSGHQPVYE